MADVAAAQTTPTPSPSRGQSPGNFFGSQNFRKAREALNSPMSLEAQMLADFRESVVKERAKRAQGEIPDYIGQRQQMTDYRTNPYSSRHREKRFDQMQDQITGSHLLENATRQGFTEAFSKPEGELSPLAQAGQAANKEAILEKFRSQQQKSQLQQKTQGADEADPIAQAKNKAQEEIRKQIKNGIRRGAEELAQSIGNAIDVGTTGISTLVTIFVYAFTLVDLNLQMIWGHYITKKKSIFFPALDWTPIPMPSIVPVQILHVGLVLVDILVFGLLVLACTFSMIVMFMPYIIAAVGIVAAIKLFGSISSYFL